MTRRPTSRPAVLGIVALVVAGCAGGGMRRVPGSDIVLREPPRLGPSVTAGRCRTQPEGPDSAYVGRRACSVSQIDSVPKPSDQAGQPPRKTP